MKDAVARVLMTTDTVGGIWNFALQLATTLGDQGIQFALATMGAPLTADQRRALVRLDNVELFESRFKLEWMDSPWNDVQRCGGWLLELEDFFRPDVVHLNSYSYGALPWRVPTLVVGHSCVFSWFAAVKGCPAPPSFWRYRNAVRAGLRGADTVTAPTQNMLESLLHFYGPFNAVDPISNGRSFHGPSVRKKENFIITAGRLWDQAKNIAILEKAAGAIRWPILAAGDAENPNGGVAEFKNLHLLGQLSDMEIADRLARASIFALPARYEPFGLCALEAALAGCALVLGDIPSLREVWGEAAIFVCPDDEEEISDKLNRLIADPDLRIEFASRARRRASEYLPEKMANSYFALYQSLLNRRLNSSAHTGPVTQTVAARRSS
ncbi:MAG TPA: glycosyltransferase family 4 protein [Acidobacteriota bacterium]|nr:glycosyltransferase family 4 protein [Acidobacteriota bacterium]